MKDQFEYFKSLHAQTDPLLIANVWNAQSARAFEKAGYKALATSSAAVAETLGYADGEEISFDTCLFVAQHIAKSTSLPVSVDVEAGYSDDPAEVIRNVRALADAGIVGINIEDSVVINGKRGATDANIFANRLKETIEGLTDSNTSVFVNVRCDAFLLGMPSPVEEAKRRMALYEKAGAHGLFLPCITALADIRAVVNASKLPVNVMCMPNLPNFAELKAAGVKRISMGNFLNKHIYTKVEEVASQVMRDGSFSTLFQP